MHDTKVIKPFKLFEIPKILTKESLHRKVQGFFRCTEKLHGIAQPMDGKTCIGKGASLLQGNQRQGNGVRHADENRGSKGNSSRSRDRSRSKASWDSSAIGAQFDADSFFVIFICTFGDICTCNGVGNQVNTRLKNRKYACAWCMGKAGSLFQLIAIKNKGRAG